MIAESVAYNRERRWCFLEPVQPAAFFNEKRKEKKRKKRKTQDRELEWLARSLMASLGGLPIDTYQCQGEQKGAELLNTGYHCRRLLERVGGILCLKCGRM